MYEILKTMWITCKGCGTRWYNSPDSAHCGTCHQTFLPNSAVVKCPGGVVK